MLKKLYLNLSLLIFIFSISIFAVNAQVVINEFSAANYSFLDVEVGYFDYEFEDWVELYNSSNQTIDLSGYHLSDRMGNPTKWTFPAGSVIPGGKYLMIYCSGLDGDILGNLHASFKITQTRPNEAVVFADPDGNIIDSNPIDAANQKNHSWGRISDGAEEWGVLTTPTPNEANVDVQNIYATKPELFPEAGEHTGPVSVSIVSGTDLTTYYTTDGSTPDENANLYTGPFMVNNTSIVKAISYSSEPSTPPSFVEFHTYLINEGHSVKVISIGGETIPNLMDGEFNDPEGTFELFDNGERVSDASGEFNKHGNDSWAYAQRGIDYITRDQFGDDWAVKHDVFPEYTDRDRFQRLILKAAANDNYPFENGGAHIRDAFVHALSQRANLDMDERTYEPCVLYVNGEYWGVYEIREKVDDSDYTDYYYDQDEEDIDFIKTWGGTWEEYGSWDDWYVLRDYINNNDLSNDDNYAYVEGELNVLSLIDYIILHSHNVSSDWLNWNTAWWRGRNPDGEALKWRYILWDEDATFGHYINYTGIPDDSPTADPCDPEEISPGTDFEGHIEIFTDLWVNENFRTLYINRYADLNNTFFRCDYMIPMLEELIARITPEMPRHIDRWGGSVSEWEENVQDLKDFIETRCTIIDDAIVDCYEDDGITGPYDVLINVDPPLTGKVQANTMIGQNYPWNTTYFGGINIELTAIPEEGYIFHHWEVASNIFAPDQFAEAISMSLEMNDEITAFFVVEVPCVAPFDVTLEVTETTADLTWIGATNNISYEFRFRPVGTEEWEVISVLDGNHFLSGLQFCTDYEIQIRGICESAWSDFLDYSFTTACATHTSEVGDKSINGIKVYPNPFESYIQIELALNQREDITIELITLTGQLVHQQAHKNLPQGTSNLSIETASSMSSGIYLLRIMSAEDLMVRRVVKE